MSDDQSIEPVVPGPREYFDQIAMTLYVNDDVTKNESPEEWHLVVSSTRSGNDLTGIEEAVESFIRDSSETAYPPNYHLEISKRHFSWGADAVTVSVILGVSTWVATSAAWDILKFLGKRLGRALADEPYIERLTEEEAVRLARHVVYNRHKVPHDLLKLTSADVDSDNKARLCFVDHYGVEYDIRIESADGVASVLNIARKFPYPQ